MTSVERWGDAAGANPAGARSHVTPPRQSYYGARCESGVVLCCGEVWMGT